MNPLVKSIDPVTVDAMTGRQAIVYFHCDDYVVNESAMFKNQIGKVTFIVGITEMIEGKGHIPIATIAPNPKQAEYKFSTFMDQIGTSLFADTEGFRQRKAELMLQQIAYNSANYFGLTAEKLEICS